MQNLSLIVQAKLTYLIKKAELWITASLKRKNLNPAFIRLDEVLPAS